MLARQVAILSGCGINPFTYQKMKQVRTLSVDLENPERIIRRTSTAILKAAVARGYTKEPSAKLLIKPSGLDLMKAEDRFVLESAIDEAKPELLVMGPLYKAFIDPGGRTSEAVAVEIARYLDHVRDTYKCALWLEHHAPLGDSMSNRQMRPFGSAVWSRWPEFGLALTPDLTSGIPFCYDVRHFRGARDERPFPTKMVRGKLFPFEVIEYAKVSK
jgi:replicative DNA helicase